MTTGWDQTHLVPNTLNYLIFVTLGWIPKLSFLGYVEVEKKMGCGLVAEPMCRVGRLRSLCVGWVGGFLTIMPRCGSILQAGPWQILSLAQNPRWSECGNRQTDCRTHSLTNCFLYLDKLNLLRRCYGNFFCCDDQKIHRGDSLDHEEVDIPLKTNYLGRKNYSSGLSLHILILGR